MAELSPTAQAVIKAYKDSGVLRGPALGVLRGPALAAALRAAAPQMEFVQDHLKLQAIAAELDGSQLTKEGG